MTTGRSTLSLLGMLPRAVAQPAPGGSKMTWTRSAILAVVAACVVVAAACTVAEEKDLRLQAPTTTRFAVGQRWHYKTRTGEEPSILSIVKIDGIAGKGNVIHISLDGLRIKNPAAPNGFTDRADHLPFSEEAIEKSVTNLVGTETTGTDWQQGYAMWEAEYRKGRAGHFTIPVAEAVATLGEVLANPKDSPLGTVEELPPNGSIKAP